MDGASRPIGWKELVVAHEAYAHKLTSAGVPVTAVRYLGTIHDFVMLNAISDTPAARAAIE